MNILLINHYAGSPAMGMEFRPWYMAREWMKNGHKVLIVSASFRHSRSIHPKDLGKKDRCEIEGVDYLIIPTTKYKGNGLGRILNIFLFVIQLIFRSHGLARKFKPDVVIASSTYPSDMYPAKRIARYSKAKLVFEVHDLWPLSPMLLGGFKPSHPFIRMMQHGEDYACKNADFLISMLPLTKEHFIKRGLEEQKWNYVPNGIDPETYAGQIELPPEIKQKLEQIRKDYKYVVMYAGSHGIANSLDTILDSSQYLKQSGIAMVLAGQGPEKEKLVEKARAMGNDFVFFIDPVPKNAVPAMLSYADVLLIAWNKSPLYKYGISPNKIFDYMMAAKPIIHAVDAGNDLVADAQCGISIEPENPPLLAEAIEKLTAMSEKEQAEMGRRGKDFVLNNHTYPILAKRFLQYIS